MPRTQSTFVSLSLALALSAPAGAQSFAQLESVLRDHPTLQVMDHQAQARRELATAATALPDPVLSLGINNFPLFDPSFNEFLPTNKAFGVRQQFPNRAGRQARADEALARASATQDMRRQRYAALRGELIALLHEQKRIARQRTLAQARHSKYDELTQVAESEIDAGRPALFRLAEIEGERVEVDRTLVELEGQKARIDARLIDLVGAVPTTPAPPVRTIEWNGDVMAFHATRVAGAAVTVRDRGIDNAEAALKPDWGAQLTYQQRESGANFAGDDWVSVMLTFSAPVWSSRSQQPRLRAAKAEHAAAQADYAATAREVTAQYATYRAMRQAAQDSAAVLEQKIAAIEDEVAAQFTVYESGAGDYSRIIDGEIAILSLRADIAAQQARMATATARMNALLVTQ